MNARILTTLASTTTALALLLGAGACTDPDPGAGGTDVTATPDESSQTDDGAQPDTTVEPDAAEPDVTEEPVALAVTAVTPTRGLASGLEQVEIQGTGFKSGMQVYFAESLAQDAFVLDSKRMAVLTPPRVPGLADVRVVDPTVDPPVSAVLEDAYLFYNPVEVLAIDPPSGHVLGGDAVTITGTGFVAGSQVLIGGRSAIDIEVLDDNTILAVTPDAATAGPVDVHVSNSIGIGALEDGFLYYDSPAVTRVTPPVGPVEGGTSVEIEGAGFVEPLAVSFGGVPLVDVEVLDASRLRGKTAAAAEAGPVDVLVSTTFGAGVLTDGFTFLEDMEPGTTVDILAVTPPAGPSAGGNLVQIIAKGLTFAGDTSVTFGGAPAIIKSVDAPSHLVLVEAPAGDVGSVDVVLTNGNGSDTAPAAYTYEAFVKVYEVMPNYGPTSGGTAITITGKGFGAGAQVRIGALPAAQVNVVDDETITAVTPPGSPGLANVTVMQGLLQDTLIGGFSYQSKMDLWVVDPPQGSQAGGTLISLFGSGFPSDAKVLVGGKPATHLKVVSSTLVQAKTPPGEIGTVDVTVKSATKGEVTLPLSFTYYDPESLYGGTWGQDVEGDVNVTVLSGADGSPIPDAFVMLWTDPQTPYQGYTNQQGQITFSGPDLLGEQMVSASKEGFASVSVIEYSATNVTLYMTPTAMGSGPPPPGVVAPVFKGQVVNLTKYVPVPWGKCADKKDAPGLLCDPCTTNADCGGLTCSEIPGQGKFCTNHCSTDAQCADGFMCYPLNGVSEHQCVPQSGVVTAYCDHTVPTIFSQDRQWPPSNEPRPGLQVEDDFSFEMTLPIGEMAVYCWGGIFNEDTQIFTPYALGVKRHVMALPGEVYEEDILLNHALTGELQVRLDNPPSGVNGPDFNYMFLYLDLGSDGVILFLDDAFSYGDPVLTKTEVPKSLTGDLYDASWTLLAGAFSFTDDNMPYSVVLKKNIKSVEDDTIYVVGDEGWEAQKSGITNNLNGLWGQAPGDVLGVGTDGLIVRSIGTSWANQASGTTEHLRAVHGLPSGHAVAVGDHGVATHYDGTVWQPMETDPTCDPTSSFDGCELTGVWMAAPNDVYAVGWYRLMHFDGGSWTKLSAGNTSKNFQGIWGFGPDDIWTVSNYGQVTHYDGTTWATVPTGTTQNLRAVWGPAPDDVYIVGEAGTILHWDGVELLPMPIDKLTTLTDVWGTGSNDIYAVGARGTILRYDGTQWLDETPPGYDSTFLAVGGTSDGRVVASGTHELLLGPLMAVPENIQPADGGIMGDEYTISWDLQLGPDPHFSYVQVAVPGLLGPVPEWTTINDWNVTDILLPDFPNIEGTPGISNGSKILTIIRVYKEGFDIDNYSNLDLNQLNWNAWAQDITTFTK